MCIKCWWNRLQVSFHQHFMCVIFGTKVTFLYLRFGFVIFWQNNIGAKVLVKCWWNWLQVSISPTFYKQFFLTKSFVQLFISFDLNVCFDLSYIQIRFIAIYNILKVIKCPKTMLQNCICFKNILYTLESQQNKKLNYNWLKAFIICIKANKSVQLVQLDTTLNYIYLSESYKFFPIRQTYILSYNLCL